MPRQSVFPVSAGQIDAEVGVDERQGCTPRESEAVPHRFKHPGRRRQIHHLRHVRQGAIDEALVRCVAGVEPEEAPIQFLDTAGKCRVERPAGVEQYLSARLDQLYRAASLACRHGCLKKSME